MSLVRWKPLRELTGIQDDINRLFDDVFTRSSGTYDNLVVPPMDIKETEDELVLTLDLPGVEKDGIDISLHDGVLTIKGEKKQEKEEKKANYHRLERVYGSFSRSLSLPNTIDPESVKGNYRDGVLTVTIGKRPETKPKQIKVDVS